MLVKSNLFFAMCVVVSLAPPLLAGELVVSTEFEGGSAEVLRIDQQIRHVSIRPAGDSQFGWPCWSAGCASGEEPYTLRILWDLEVGPRFGSVPLQIVATDADEHLLERAREASFQISSLKEVPDRWRQEAFVREGHRYRVVTRGFRGPGGPSGGACSGCQSGSGAAGPDRSM